MNLVPRRIWNDFAEPEAMDPDVCILEAFTDGPNLFTTFKIVHSLQISVYMPQLKLMKSIIERMKNLANMGTLHITSEGLLTLTVETDTVSVTSHFDDLYVEKHSNPYR